MKTDNLTSLNQSTILPPPKFNFKEKIFILNSHDIFFGEVYGIILDKEGSGYVYNLSGYNHYVFDGINTPKKLNISSNYTWDRVTENSITKLTNDNLNALFYGLTTIISSKEEFKQMLIDFRLDPDLYINIYDAKDLSPKALPLLPVTSPTTQPKIPLERVR